MLTELWGQRTWRDKAISTSVFLILIEETLPDPASTSSNRTSSCGATDWGHPTADGDGQRQRCGILPATSRPAFELRRTLGAPCTANMGQEHTHPGCLAATGQVPLYPDVIAAV